ncbi:hypothetical protein OAJ74_00290 [Alphaproteobacteria bacterium]|nr:hypothetical protein [Alphaproteobacteria bacterium]
MNSFRALLKEFFFGFIVFLIPVVTFFKPYNLRQLANFETYIIFESLIVAIFLLIFFSIFLHFTIIKIFKIRPRSIFLLSCFGFYILFLFAPIHDLLAKTIFHQGKATYFTVFFLFLIWLSIFVSILYSQKFNLFFCRSLLIFASINILLSLLAYPKYLNEIWNSKPGNNEIQSLRQQLPLPLQQHLFQQQLQDWQYIENFIDSDKINSIIKKNKINDRNIYYIIMDSMMSLEFAAKINIINEIQIKKNLQQLDLTYIDQSYASYDTSYLTLASIMEIDYPITELDLPHRDTKNFFPLMMYQNEKSIPLPDLINKLGSEFTWVGNISRPCLEWENQSWNCIYSNYIKKFRLLVRTIYYNTPLERLIFNIFTEGDNQASLYYLKYAKKSKKNNNSKFVFIDQILPHSPYNVTKHCSPRVENKNLYEGYKSNYQCALKVITDFITYISIEDPKAIIVIQGDHGHTIPEKIKTKKDKTLYRASIFNAIKAPAECFKKFGKPHSNVNTVRFVLNCAYGFDFPYRQIIHYQRLDLVENDSFYVRINSHIF